MDDGTKHGCQKWRDFKVSVKNSCEAVSRRQHGGSKLAATVTIDQEYSFKCFHS